MKKMRKVLLVEEKGGSNNAVEIEIIDQPDSFWALGAAWRELCERVPVRWSHIVGQFGGKVKVLSNSGSSVNHS